MWAPDEQIFELYYGIEQISWNGYARPAPMRHGTPTPPMEPQLPDYELVPTDIEKGINVLDGYRWVSAMPLKYSVDGVLLPQPFKITRVGPVNLFVDDYENANVGTRVAGLYSDRRSRVARRTLCLPSLRQRASFAWPFPQILAQKTGPQRDTSNMSFGLQLANYQQLRAAVTFLRDNGVRVETDIIPPEIASRH